MHAHSLNLGRNKTKYIGRANRNCKTRFEECRKDFTYVEGESSFANHAIKEHGMRYMDGIMIIIEKNSGSTLQG